MMYLQNKETGEIRPAEARRDGIYLYDDVTEKWYKYELVSLGRWWGYYEGPDPAVIDLMKKWDKKAIKTKVGLLVAPKNYKEGKKEHFTWDEAMEAQKKMGDTGWRLPTVAELVQLYGAYGIDKDGKDDAMTMTKRLNIPFAGYYGGSSLNGLGQNAHWWSSTQQSDTAGYSLALHSEYRNVYPQSYYNKFYGFSVRMVKEIGRKWDDLKRPLSL